MARQEATNIFSDGLMSDLHPINTPKSVLTDCLNGTYITYNGNEFILQNDMGNYKLKNCRLPVNFIPVGVKSYADILYIVSYNPLTKKVEIGSYPAPQRIFSTGDNDTMVDLIPFRIDGEKKYLDIINSDKKPLFVFMKETEDENTFKLYPGDEFKLVMDDLDLEYIYQHLNYYIIDEDKRLYDLDDADFENAPKDENGFSKVFWETPGWLAAQWNLFVPDKFNLNLRSLNVPEFLVIDDAKTLNDSDNLEDWEADSGYFKVSMDLSSQTIITDLLFQSKLKDNFDYERSQTFDHLYIRYLIKTGTNYGEFQGLQYVDTKNKYEVLTADLKTGEMDGYIYFDIPCYLHNYQDDVITAYNNIYSVWQYPFPEEIENGYNVAGYEGKVEIKAYPILKISDGIAVLFTQFATTQQFDLNNLKNSGDIKIADSIYKWSVDDDSCTISFNINGPFVNSSNITGRYEIYRLNMFTYTDKEPTWRSQTSVSTWTDNDIEQNIKTNKFGYLSNISDENVKNRTFQELDSDELSPHLRMSNNVPGNLLMVSGDIPNVVLYGQNTINIDWQNSNSITLNNYTNWYSQDSKYETVDNITINGPVTGTIGGSIDGSGSILPNLRPLKQEMIKDEYVTSKTLSFSKEGGLYIFRIILEQDKKSIKIQDNLLIPSEVFNDFFGSVDNYNSISGDTWINKYIGLIDYSGINLQNLNIQITPNETDKFLEYRWASNSDWILLDRESIINNSGVIDWSNSDNAFRQYIRDPKTVLTTTQCIGLVYWIKDSNCVAYTLDVNNSNLEKKLIFSWKQSEKETAIENLFIRYNYNKIKNKTITWDTTQSVAKILKGNLWNPVINTTADLKVGTTNTGLQLNDNGHETTINFETFNTIQTLKTEIKETPGTTRISSYPFLDSIARGYSVGIECSLNKWSTKNDHDIQYKVMLDDSSKQNTDYGDPFREEGTSGDQDTKQGMGKANIQALFGSILSNVNCALGCRFYSWVDVSSNTTHNGNLYLGEGSDNTSNCSTNFIHYGIDDWQYDFPQSYWSTYRNILFVKNAVVGVNTYVTALKMDWATICLFLRVRLDKKGTPVTWRYPYLSWQDSFVFVINYNINKAAITTDIRYLRVDDYIWKPNKSNINLLNINYITKIKSQADVNVPNYLFTLDLYNDIFSNVGIALADIVKKNNAIWDEINAADEAGEFLFIETDPVALRKYVEANLMGYVSSSTWTFKVLNTYTTQQQGGGEFSDIQNSNVYFPWANSGTIFNDGDSNTGGFNLQFIWDDMDQTAKLKRIKDLFGGTLDDWTDGVYFRSKELSPTVIKGVTSSNARSSYVSYCYYQDF